MKAVVLNPRYALIALLAMLAIGLGIEVDWGGAFGNSDAPTARGAGGKSDVATVLPDFRLGSDAAMYSQIAEKPLLNPSRKPAPTQAVVATTEPPKPQIRRGLYQLVGVMDLGKVRIAQVRDVASNRVVSVRTGDKLQELTVEDIDASNLRLAFQGEYELLTLAKFTPSGRVPPPPAPPLPPPVQPQPVAATPAPAPVPVAAAAPMPVPVAEANAIMALRRRREMEAVRAGQRVAEAATNVNAAPGAVSPQPFAPAPAPSPAQAPSAGGFGPTPR